MAKMNLDCLKKESDLEFLKEIFNILSEPNRIKILCLLLKEKELCVCEIVEKLDLKQNLISHHIWMFKRIGIMTSKRDGKKIYYTVNQEKYAKVKNLIKSILNF